MTTQYLSAGRQSARIAPARNRHLHRTASAIALATGMIGLAGLATPAAAQCVEGVPGEYTCSGDLQIGQIIVGDDISAATTAGFAVDTTANGNGLALSMTGDGRIEYVDLQGSSLTGAGVRFASTGPSGSNVGSINIFSDGAIAADGAVGLRLDNAGGGDTTATWLGSILNTAGDGVFVRTEAGSGEVSLTFGDVTATSAGIEVENFGTGATSIVATGAVTAGTGRGVSGLNDVTATDLSIEVVDVFGAIGIVAENNGTGSTAIVSTGDITSFALEGIRASNGVNAVDLTIDVNDVFGSQNGIGVVNFGHGLTDVRSSGTVFGDNQDGINIRTGTGSAGVLVAVAEVQGSIDGIDVENEGLGAASVVTATGDITAISESGILIRNGVAASDILVDVAGVTGGDRGIAAHNFGTGSVFVRATGPVVGGDVAIQAQSITTAGPIFVEAVDTTGGRYGIVAASSGFGSVTVLSTGTAIGTDDVGVRAFGFTDTTTISIDANNAYGGVSGISAVSVGQGSVDIITRGLVEGGNEGIEAISDLHEVTILNEGIVRNASGLSSDRAIDADGGTSVVIDNQGVLTGSMRVIAASSLTTNRADWNSIGGTSSFTGADDSVFNMATGTIFGAAAAGLAETTTWSGLELFVNRGELLLADGGTGDLVQSTGDALFESTAVLTADIGGAGGSDTFRTTGAVDIEPGSLLIVNTAQPLVLNSQYVIVDAAGGVTGEFDFDDQMITAFTGLRDGYSTNTAFVEFVQLKALADVALTPNQEETAEGADSLPDGNAIKDALLLLPDDEAAQDAFDLLSGEIHPSARTAMAEDSRLPRTAVLDRLGYGEPERSVWGRVFGSFGGSDGDSNAAELDRDTRGMMFGVDKTFGGFIVGAAAGAFETELDVSDRASTGTVESVHGLVYAGGRFGAWTVRGGVGYAVTSTDTRREIVFPGVFAVTEADYEGSVLQGFVEAGYRLPLGSGHVEPFVGLTALQVKTNAFAETGGPAALSGRSQTEQVAVSTVGLRFETSPEGTYSLRGSTGWRHSRGDLDPTGVHAFDGGAPFTILGAAQSTDAAFANVEARWKVSPAATFGIAYDGVLGADGEDHAITGSLRVVF